MIFMEYRLIRSDELYHYGVPGMKWGHRKGPTSLSGTGHRAMAGIYGMNQRFYNKTGNKALASMNAQARNRSLKKAADADAAKANVSSEQRRARVKKAAKVGAAVAVTALAAYGGYKAYKLHGEATTSLGKKYSKLSKDYMDLAQMHRDTAWSQGQQADKYKLLAGYVRKNEPGNKAEYNIYTKASKDLAQIAKESHATADKRLDEAMRYSIKAQNKDFGKKEVAREMVDIAKKKYRRR